MNKAGGFITLHRQILDWGWYKNSGTKDLFLHLLLTANFTDSYFHGQLIRRGQIVTSLPSLSTETGLSIQQIRTALMHLTSTGEITDEANQHYRIITVVKYDDYQSSTDRSTDNQQTINRQANRQSTDRLAVNQQHHNNNNNINNETNKQGNNNPSPSDIHQTAFNIFWATYPKKVAKQAAIAAWKKVDQDRALYHEIMQGLSRWKESYEWQKESGRYIPNPASWLNGRRWEDEIPEYGKPEVPAPRPVKQVIAQQYEQRDYGDEDAAIMRQQIEMIRRMNHG
jgi:hypothetical protein